MRIINNDELLLVSGAGEANDEENRRPPQPRRSPSEEEGGSRGNERGGACEAPRMGDRPRVCDSVYFPQEGAIDINPGPPGATRLERLPDGRIVAR